MFSSQVLLASAGGPRSSFPPRSCSKRYMLGCCRALYSFVASPVSFENGAHKICVGDSARDWAEVSDRILVSLATPATFEGQPRPMFPVLRNMPRSRKQARNAEEQELYWVFGCALWPVDAPVVLGGVMQD